ncbi:MAG: nucleotidyltransferase family protein, partial [Terriglobia bacterium]
MTNHLQIPQGRIADFCQRHSIRELAVFGSVLREDFGPDSDVDVLVEFEPDTHYGLLALAGMQSELEEILGRGVDLVEESAIENSRNYIRRKAILSSAETVYRSDKVWETVQN